MNQTSEKAERAAALAKTAIFTLVMPCSVTVWFPWALGLIRTGTPRDPAEASGAQVLTLGAVIYGACAFSFAWLGRGTPSPTDYTRSLVVAGLYRYSRNPMYVGVLLVLTGEFMLFGTSLPASVTYEYTEYCRRVRRWF